MARGPRVVPFPVQLASWSGLLRSDARGRIYPDLANVLIALRSEPQLRDALAFDEMLQESMLQKPPPIAPGSTAGEPPPKKVTDDDVGRVQEWLQHVGMPKIGREIVGQAVEIRARDSRYHPVRDRLQEVEWDGEPRKGTWLKVYMGASGGDEYLTAIGSMFLVAMIARIMDPGCKVDYMLVLEGEQGAMKSLACRILAGEAYFSDDLGDIGNKDAKQHLRGKWLVEESELANFSRATTETLKAFLSRTHEKYRPPYAKAQVDEPRQCVIVGTTNKGDWNKDDTGARRFWPVKVGRIDIEALKRDREQLFAEALHAYRMGEQWWPDHEFEAQFIKPEQDARRSIDAWEPEIHQWLQGREGEKIGVLEVAFGALFMERARCGTADQGRIKACMTLAGWKKDPKRTNRGFLWEYVGNV